MARALKAQIYAQFARVSKATSSPQRLELLDLLAQAERTVEALAAATDQPVANASHHLQVLKQARLVESRKDGLYVYYRLASPQVAVYLQSLRGLAEQRLDEVADAVRRYLHHRDEFAPVSHAELTALIERGDVTVLDVRPSEEYRAAHIRGAISVPVRELKRHLAELPPGQQIVAYCRGPYCVYSYQAVRILRAHGFDARRLVDGLPEWRSAGLAIAAAPQLGTAA